MFQNILVPVDFTPKNKRAIAAALQAGGDKARLTLIHVVEKIERIPSKELKDFYEELMTEARLQMKRLTKGISHPKLHTEIFLGKRVESIVNYARKKEIDLIVMNSHQIAPERKGQDWGTISYKVAILAPSPILLVK